jgi:hypothetical protein
MLISRRSDGLTLVTQQEHARLAGTLAERWGNERFEVGPQHPSLVIAARRHDDGWESLDAAPVIAAGEGRPAHFLELTLEQTVAPYREGVERIYEEDRRAGVLASMHWAGLYSARWGLDGGGTPVGHPLARGVVEAEEVRIAPVVRELWGASGLRSDFEAALWRDYELLQALDSLSLALCLLDLGTPSASEELALFGTLRPIDQAPGGRIVEHAPAADGERLALHVRVVAPGVVLVDPFPFSASAIEVEIEARRIKDVRHGSEAAAVAAYVEADRITVPAALVSLDTWEGGL